MRALLAAMLVCALTPAAASAATSVSSGGATASIDGAHATLANGRITRTWAARPGGSGVTTALRDDATGAQWSNGGSWDFTLDLDGAATSSSGSTWLVRSVSARKEPFDPARPKRQRGVQLVFVYGLDPVGLVTMERTYTLRPGAAVIGVTAVLHNGTPAPLRVASYTLDQIVTGRDVEAHLLTYHGGSDWRDDYRAATTEAPRSQFDDEAEVARFDDGKGSGFFFVSERRSGAMNRAGTEQIAGVGARRWIGVDHARDLLDGGPLLTDPPDYNRVDNPAYPVPARARLVPPLGTLRLGRAYTGVYSGGEQGAGAAFASEFARNEMPRFPRTVGLNTFHPWSHSADLSDNPKLRAQVDIAKELGLETFMIDDQWQGGAGGESGDWQWDPARFPDRDGDGQPDFVSYIHAMGLQLGLWMSPLEFNQNSDTYKQHPDWVCTPTGDATSQVPDDAGLGVWDVTNPSFQDYLSGVVDRLIAKYDVREFKFDFMAWVDCPPHDYLDYEDAFVALVRRFEKNHPGVTFELDETNDQRSWPFESAALGPSWFDNAHTHAVGTKQSKLLHDIWTAAPWLPPSSIGFGAYDDTLVAPYTVDYLFPMALLSHLTFWSDLSKLSAADRAETAWWIRWYKANRRALGGVVFNAIDRDPLDGKGWAAFQPWTGRRGFLFAFRQGDGPAAQAVVLHGLVGSRLYSVRNVRTGASLGTFSGEQLSTRGLDVRLPDPYSAVVLAVDPA